MLSASHISLPTVLPVILQDERYRPHLQRDEVTCSVPRSPEVAVGRQSRIEAAPGLCSFPFITPHPPFLGCGSEFPIVFYMLFCLTFIHAALQRNMSLLVAGDRNKNNGDDWIQTCPAPAFCSPILYPPSSFRCSPLKLLLIDSICFSATLALPLPRSMVLGHRPLGASIFSPIRREE